MRKLAFILILTAFVAGCSSPEPTPPVSQRKEFVSGVEELYGTFYANVPRQVAALDLYSEGLSFDSLHHLVGSGTRLYISDIFLADSVLSEGTYLSDTTTLAYTFLPGKNFEGNPTGICCSQVTNAVVTSITIYDKGSMQVSRWADSTDILITFPATKSQKRDFIAHFRGVLMRDDHR